MEKRDDFLWPVDNQPPMPRKPNPLDPDSKRTIDYIPPEELGTAMLLIVENSAGISIRSLFSETVRLFGFIRLTQDVETYLLSGLDHLQKTGRCNVSDDYVTLK
jgi:hypothetical protein